MADEYTTLTSFAKRLNVSRKTFYQWRDMTGFPVNREPPWTEDDAREVDRWDWARASPQRDKAPPQVMPDGIDGDDAVTWREKKDRGLALKYHADALKAWGRVAEVDKIIADGVSIAVEARTRMMMIPPSVAPLCVGKTAPEIEQTLEEYIRKILDEFAHSLGDGAGNSEAPGVDGEGDTNAAPVAAERMG